VFRATPPYHLNSVISTEGALLRRSGETSAFRDARTGTIISTSKLYISHFFRAIEAEHDNKIIQTGFTTGVTMFSLGSLKLSTRPRAW
jgi:hypothetical protein